MIVRFHLGDYYVTVEVQNLAVMALLKSLEQNNIDKNQLLSGTQLQMGNILKTKKTHSWDQFVKMYENCSKLLGENQAAREIAYQGINNQEISTLMKIGAGFFDPKTAYWAMATFLGKHLFKECVNFQYKKIDTRHIRMTITINPKLQDCPLLLETYTHLLANVPTVLGQPRAEVVPSISERKGEFDIFIKKASPLKDLFTNILKFKEGYKSTITIMGELEAQSGELSRLIEDKSRLLQVLSHDISNQVSIIDFYLSKTLNQGDLSAEHQKSLEIVYTSTKKLCGILKNVQKIEVSQIRGIVPEPVELEPIFDSIASQYAGALEKKNLSLRCLNEVPAEIFVLAEKTALELNILGNLISNAIKFSPEGSVITLSARTSNDKVLISVTDQGVGISTKDVEGIFSRKIRISNVGTSGETGTGFGLGIVYNYTSLLEGKVSIQPNNPRGSIFTVELPLYMPRTVDSHFLQQEIVTNLTIRN